MIDLKERKREMDDEIRKSLSDIISRFHKDTGLVPSSINFEIIDTSTYGGINRPVTVGDITTEVKL